MEISKVESVTLAKFKKIMENEIGDGMELTDLDFLRFLRARNSELEKAEKMLKSHLEWRKRVNFAQAKDWTILEILTETFPYFLDGRDKEGRSTAYFPVGTWPIRQHFSAGYEPEIEKFVYNAMAKCKENVDNSGRDQYVVIVDFEDISYKQFAHYEALQMLYRTFREYEQNFPEYLYLAIIINAPWALTVIVPTINTIISGSTVDKVKIFDSNASTFLPYIMENIPYHGLPMNFRKRYSELLTK